MRISRQEVLKLYRELINYSKTLKYTDKDYYLTRVKKEFIQNKHLESEEEISHQYNVCMHDTHCYYLLIYFFKLFSLSFKIVFKLTLFDNYGIKSKKCAVILMK